MPTDVLLCFAAANQMWAEWFTRQLEEAGVGVRLHVADVREANSEPLEESAFSGDQLILLLSRDYPDAAGTLDDLRAVATARNLEPPPVLLVTLDDQAVPPQLRQVPRIDMELAREEQAGSTLRQALGLPGPKPSPDLDLCRFPLTEPQLSNLPQRRLQFTRRNHLLYELRRRFVSSDPVVRTQVLCGPAGAGKSHLVLEYAYRFAGDYDIIWWVQATSAETARASLHDLAAGLGIQTTWEATAVERLVRALSDDQRYGRWLLIFDEVSTVGSIAGLVPQGMGQILVAADSETNEWAQVPGVFVEQFQGFSRAESVAHVKHLLAGISDHDAAELADQLADRPFAIELAAAYCSTTNTEPSRYLELIRSQLGPPAEQSPAERRVGETALQMSLNWLAEHHQTAYYALQLCAFLGRDPIPRSVLASEPSLSMLEKYSPGIEPDAITAMTRVMELLQLADVNVARKTVQLKPQVQAAMRLRAKDPAEEQQLAFAALAATNPRNPDDDTSWPAYHALWPHLRCPGLLETVTEPVKRLVVDMARYRYSYADYTGCERLCRDVSKLWSRVPGTGDLAYLRLQGQLAGALRRLGRYEDALALDRTTYKRMTERLGESEKQTLTVQSGLAADLRVLGQYKKALEHDLQTLALATSELGPTDPRTLLFASNVADSYRMTGEFERALELDSQTFHTRSTVLGRYHRSTLHSASNYGRDMREMGDLEGSRSRLEFALDGYRRVLGSDHPDTLRAAKNLAVTLRRLGRFAEAHELGIDTLMRYNRRLGTAHPGTLICQVAVATTYAGVNENELAKSVGTKAWQGLVKLFGADHAYPLMARSNVAVFDQKLRRDDLLTDAEFSAEVGDLKAVMDKLARALGRDHPYVFMVALNLANVNAAQGRHFDARIQDEETHRRLLRRFNSLTHPDVIAATINLAIGQRAVGDESAAETMRVALASAREALGDDHPRTVAALNWKRWVNTYLDPPPL